MGELASLWHWWHLWGRARRSMKYRPLDAEHTIIMVVFCASDRWSSSSFLNLDELREWSMMAFIAFVIKPWWQVVLWYNYNYEHTKRIRYGDFTTRDWHANRSRLVNHHSRVLVYLAIVARRLLMSDGRFVLTADHRLAAVRAELR